MNTKSRAEAKNDFEKNFFKLMNNSAFGKTMKNVRKHRDIKLAATKRKMKKKGRNAEMKKAKVKMNKAKYLGMSILDISKTLMYEFWYDYIKPKYQEKAKLCYMDTGSFIIHIKTEELYEETLLMMLKNCLTHLTMMSSTPLRAIKDRFQLARTKK